MQLLQTFTQVRHKALMFLDPLWNYLETKPGYGRRYARARCRRRAEAKVREAAKRRRRASKNEVSNKIAQRRKDFEAYQASKKVSRRKAAGKALGSTSDDCSVLSDEWSDCSDEGSVALLVA